MQNLSIVAYRQFVHFNPHSDKKERYTQIGATASASLINLLNYTWGSYEYN